MIKFKRGANPGKGKEYEINTIGLMCLRLFNHLSTQEDFDDFDLGFNLKEMGKFDDLVIVLKKKKKPYKSMAVQLKHKEDKRQLTLDMLNADSGDFSLVQYAESTENIIDRCDYFILFSNIVFDSNEKHMVEFEIKPDDKKEIIFLKTAETVNQNFTFEPIVDSKYEKFKKFLSTKSKNKIRKMKRELKIKLMNLENDFQKTSEIRKKMFEGEMNDEEENCRIFKKNYEKYLRYLDVRKITEMIKQHSTTYLKKCELFDKFFSKFSLFSNQKNKHQIKKMIQDIFEKKYNAPNSTEEFINLISAWYDDETIKDVVYHEPKLNKFRFGKLLVISLLNPFLVNVLPKNTEHQKQWQAFKVVANQFLVTVIESDIVKKWSSPLKEKNHSLWTVENNEPIIIKIDDRKNSRQVQEAIEIIKKINLEKKFIIIGNFKSSNESINEFTNLLDVEKKLSSVEMEEVVDAFYLPLELGFINREEILKTVTPTMLFNLIDEHKQKLEQLPEHYISRTMEVNSESKDGLIKEEDLPRQLQNKINILCAEPGMGKTSSMKSLHNQFISQNYYSKFISFKDHVKFFKDFTPEQNISSILKYFLEIKDGINEEMLRTQSYLSRNRVCLLFDGLDELDSIYLENAINCIQKILTFKIFKIFLSTRKHLKDPIERAFEVVTIDMSSININDQQKYLKERLTSNYKNSQVDNIIETIFRNFRYVQENSNLLGIPLQLFIITEVLLFHNGEDSVEDLLVLSKLYDKFIKGKLEHLQNKTLKQKDLVKLYDLNKFEILALRVCLDEIDFSNLIKIEEYNEKVKEVMYCLTVGIVTNFNKNGIPTFEHRTIPEYLSALYFINNFKNIKDLNSFIFKPKYKTIRYFIDMKLAENSELHLAVIYRNCDLIFKTDPTLIENARDRGNRNLLQLCICHGQDYPELKITKRTRSLWNNETYYEEPKKHDFDEFSLLLQHLSKFCNLDKEKDELFGWTSVDYAISLNNLAAIDCLLNYTNTNKSLLHYCSRNKPSILGYSSSNGFTNILKTCTKKSINNILYSSDEDKNINNSVQTPSKLKHSQFLLKDLDRLNSDNYKDKNYGFTSLHLACINGQVESLKELLKHFSDVNFMNKSGCTPLHYAAKNGHLQCLQELIKKNCDINITNKSGSSPLHYAAKNGHLECLQELLMVQNCDINIKNKWGCTALHLSAISGQVECVKLLVNNSKVQINALSKDGSIPLHYAASNGQTDCVKELAGHISDINFTNSTGHTALHLASINGQIDSLKELINFNSDINCLSNNGEIALHYAAMNGHLECLQQLIKHNASINFKNKSESTPLHYAARNGHLECLQELLRNQADINSSDIFGCTPLHETAINGQLECLRELITNNCKINPVSHDGNIPLLYAAKNGHLECLKELIKFKSDDVNFVDQSGSTALHYAAITGQIECLNELRKYNSSFEVRNKSGNTVLHLAAINGQIECMKELIRNGFDVNCVSYDGSIALHYAAKNGYVECLKELIKCGSDVNCVDETGSSALHYAAVTGQVECLKELILWKCDVKLRNKSGNDALFYAESTGHVECCKELKKYL